MRPLERSGHQVALPRSQFPPEGHLIAPPSKEPKIRKCVTTEAPQIGLEGRPDERRWAGVSLVEDALTPRNN